MFSIIVIQKKSTYPIRYSSFEMLFVLLPLCLFHKFSVHWHLLIWLFGNLNVKCYNFYSFIIVIHIKDIFEPVSIKFLKFLLHIFTFIVINPLKFSRFDILSIFNEFLRCYYVRYFHFISYLLGIIVFIVHVQT